jgi:hypothetical protein
MSSRLTADRVADIVGWVPDSWLSPADGDRDRLREAYVDYLRERLAAPRPFLAEALGVR